MSYSKSPMQRFWKNVDSHSGECWIWQGGTANGYGRFNLGKDKQFKQMPAHRFMYEEVFGLIPDGYDLDHLCRNSRCVNPAHLEPVTRRENLLRGKGLTATKAKQTHCIRGHTFDQENTIIRRNGTRCCKACYWHRPSVIKRGR